MEIEECRHSMCLRLAWNQTLHSFPLSLVHAVCVYVWVASVVLFKTHMPVQRHGEDASRMLSINSSSKLTSISILILSTLSHSLFLSPILWLPLSLGSSGDLAVTKPTVTHKHTFCHFHAAIFQFHIWAQSSGQNQNQFNNELQLNITWTTTLNMHTHSAQMSEALFVRHN